jgi:hypothetical protein
MMNTVLLALAAFGALSLVAFSLIIAGLMTAASDADDEGMMG